MLDHYSAASRSGHDSLPVCLGSENPNRLVSLWDMLRVYAVNFVSVGAELNRCAANPALIAIPDAPADATIKKRFYDAMDRICRDSVDMGMVHTLEFINSFGHLHADKSASNAEIADAVRQVHKIYQ